MYIDIHTVFCIYTGWTSVSTGVHVQPFDQHVGPTVTMPDTPLDTFSLFFTPAIIDLLVRETNRYTAQCLESSDKEWSMNAAEMRAYLGFCILMGIVRGPAIRDYWSQHEVLHYNPIAS